MGILFTKLMEIFGKPETPKRLVMVGLDAAGKTTLLYKMHLGEVVQTTATIGFNVEELKFDGWSANVWDIGGQEKLRKLWGFYLQNIDGIIYVIDSCDEERMELAAEELFAVLKDEVVQGVPLLVFANKQDCKGAMLPEKVIDVMKLRTIKDREWYCQGCSAVTGEGLSEGFSQLTKSIKEGTYGDSIHLTLPSSHHSSLSED